MEWQIGNSLFIAVTTLATFLVAGLVTKLIIKSIKWKWFGAWMVIGVCIVVIQINSTSSPKMTVKTSIPSIPNKQLTIERMELIPERSFKEWQESTDVFDGVQDERIKENKP